MGEKMVGKKYTWLITLLLKELHAEDPTKYRACLRMSPEYFDTLHDVITNDIQRLDTLMRDCHTLEN
jgi:hypothetical protein